MTMRRADLLTIPLTGLTLLEASAGTGKTYTIAGLFVRLVLERNFTPEQILVATFTEAATAELRSRIRQRLAEAAAVFGGATDTDDPFLAALVDQATNCGINRAEGRRRLLAALRSFDLAAISTIHGFCLRALQDAAFESGSPLDVALITDQTALLQEAVDDFWRERFFGSHQSLLPLLVAHDLHPDSLVPFVRQLLGNPKLRIEPAFAPATIAAMEESIVASYAELVQLWHHEGTVICEILTSWPKLSRAKDKYKDILLEPLFAEMAAYLAGGDPWTLPPGFAKWRATAIAAAMTYKGAPPEHPFFSRCEELGQAADQRLLAFKAELITAVRERLAAKKEAQAVRSFDDLLTTLYQALCSPGGDALADLLRQRFPVALIDEFQDTDPVQFDIFRRIYRDEHDPLFLIGDPKQAIYSFRGADIFAYLQAARSVPAQHGFTLDTNWRSAPGLVTGVNWLFRQRADQNPFVLRDIAFPEVHGGKESHGASLVIDGAAPEPLRLWYVDEPTPGKVMDVGEATNHIVTAVAGEIRRLVAAGAAGQATINGEPLSPRHVAVIVNSHRQAGLVRDAVSALDIPCVVRSTASLFASREALDVLALLQAVLQPANDGCVRLALVGAPFGYGGEALDSLGADTDRWGELLERLAEYRQLWEEQGVLVMGRTLLLREGVRQRLLRYPDSERRLTNLQHCFELLQDTSTARRLGPDALTAWFGEQVADKPEREEYQLRLETDAAAVSIVTIHASKGLEYPIVFCPFLWKGTKERLAGAVICHDDCDMVADFGSPQHAERRLLAQREHLAEGVRLAYVALTRAKFRCYLVWGRLKGAGSSPLAYLLHDIGGSAAGCPPPPLDHKALDGLPAEECRLRLTAIAAASADSLAIEPLPMAEETQLLPTGPDISELTCRSFTRQLRHDWRVTSFTSLSRTSRNEEERPAHDELVSTVLPEPVAAVPDSHRTIAQFARGSQAGTLLHELFEDLDFTAAPEIHRAVVARVLARHGVADLWQEPVAQMVREVLTVPLAMGCETAVTLATVPLANCLSELEFYLPLQLAGSESLRQLFRRWQGEEVVSDLVAVAEQLDFAPVSGYLRGFIDLVFCAGGRYYLTDWKSNHLGATPAEYTRERLAEEMRHHRYPLQYLLYTVALHRYLQCRLTGYDYDLHFGGAFYIFLRGVEAANGGATGIYADRPPKALIEAVTSLLLDCEEANHVA